MSKRPGSSRWLQRQHKDPYVKQAQQSDFRARSVYKLMEIDRKDRLFKRGQIIIDLGAAPGSWSQYAARQTGAAGQVIAIDILPLEPIPNVLFIKGDFTDEAVYAQCLKALKGRPADLVISDMAPNLSGIKSMDQSRSMYLAELALELACRVLRRNGVMLIKVFEGEGIAALRQSLREHFHQVVTRKPAASRSASSEFYLLARGLK